MTKANYKSQSLFGLLFQVVKVYDGGAGTLSFSSNIKNIPDLWPFDFAGLWFYLISPRLRCFHSSCLCTSLSISLPPPLSVTAATRAALSSDNEDGASEPNTVPSFFDEEVFTRQYTILKALGQGGTAKVMLARHRLTGTTVAVKALLRQEKWCESKTSEVDIMKILSHPNIISLLQVIETEQNIYLIMEVAEGEQLFNRIQRAGCLKEDEARSIFVQLLSAIGYCHDEGVIHRDLKPDNVIVDEQGKVKIIDFGLGARFRPGQKLERLCGAFQFIPPEVFLGIPYDGPKVDIWTLGVLLYYMVTGTVPFGGATLSELREQVLKGKYDIPYRLSKELRSMISLLLTMNARQRPMVWDLRGHPWLQKGEEMFTIHSNEVTRCPDPEIVAAMQNIGFDVQDIRESLKHRKFNETMAAYNLLKCQACQDNGNNVHTKLMNPGATPFPSIENPNMFPLPPKRRASEPSLRTLVPSSGSPHLRQRMRTNVPDLLEKTPTQGRGHKRSMTAPCICLLRNTIIYVDDTSFSTSSQSERTLSSLKHSGTSTSSSLQPRGRAKCKKRIRACILRLCCCMSPHKKSPRKVYSKK
ncbi:sperm motility kinase Z-like [Cricetulus griseus]|uniref:non-specific serine/threonine protein kinase n=1 Tax=Cricetulus griseus TaxID=10029 RepID=A0A9J7JA07_CRIGR|nr:sperm motility kinase Z-like [Cricetulus griseus]XP_027257690.1 sperm motility kinase Z-like [Cricetulus griseus]